MSDLFASDDLTPVLALPMIRPAQAQKHIPHNEALRLLEVLVQAGVASRSESAPPDDPAEGARFLIPAGATGAWDGRGGQIGYFAQGAWVFLTPAEGWQIWVADEALALRWQGGAWVAAQDLPLQVARLGVGATAEGANRLALAGEASLFTHQGAGHQIKINKAAAAETASLLFQTAWGGRAEMGTSGTDDFALKVSADGSTWITALSVARATGLLSGAGITQSATDEVPGRLVKSGDYGWPLGLALDAGDDPDDLPGSGVWVCASAALTAGNHYPEAAAGALVQIARPGAGAAQLYITQSGTLWSRGADSAGTWQPWMRQSSSSGSTANGSWLRLPDGTQICRRSLTPSASAATTWSYPQPFTAPPVISGTAQATVLSALCLDAAPGTTSASLSLRGADHARRADPLHLTAIGRWY
ncbi:DUF2793 domain-containing protein [Falsigemmobacter faecalis]|uniref:DUF2793 domain-containing protein n=1 Tax=Falsigemmobacter faecalis TaxID=2488730 RepID=A0A3P3DA16_9RHOB|nr:DUF2793 domain-containing protein [Falsigemmobacter faecalis]RRH71175.1 DUF2793 domain-containing protein [Falsigemmobacter faecalis]